MSSIPGTDFSIDNGRRLGGLRFNQLAVPLLQALRHWAPAPSADSPAVHGHDGREAAKGPRHKRLSRAIHLQEGCGS